MPSPSFRRRITSRALLVTLAAALMLGGCSSTGPSDPGSDPQRRVVSLQLAPAEVAVAPGTVRQLTATPRDAAGQPVTGVTIAWSTSNESVATVDGTGRVTARAPGSATILAVTNGKVAETRVQVMTSATPQPAPQVVAILPAARTAQAGQFVLTVTGTGFTPLSEMRWNGAARATQYVSATELRATILPEDVATEGTAQVTVQTPAPGGGTSAARPFTITPRVAALEVRGTTALWLGEQTALTVAARDPQGGLIPDLPLTFESNSASVTVDQQGILRAATPGRATITVRGGGREATLAVRSVAAPSLDLAYTGIGANDNLLVAITPGAGAEPRVVARPGLVVRDLAVSPDGRRIAFAGRAADGNVDVYVINRDGTGLARLTSHAATDDQPAWSPDGRSIAFRTTRDGRSDVWLMAANGRLAQTLTGGSAFGAPRYAHPVFTRDGARILLTYGDETSETWQDILAYSLETGALTPLVREANVRLDEPAPSPDGQFLVVRRQAPGESEPTLRVYQLGGTPQLLPTNYGAGRGAAWSPDGNWLAFSGAAEPGGLEQLIVTTPGAPFRKVVATGQQPVWLTR